MKTNILTTSTLALFAIPLPHAAEPGWAELKKQSNTTRLDRFTPKSARFVVF